MNVAGHQVHRQPSLLLAGVGKAGTTSLFWYLSQLAEICPSSVKETRYFLPYSEADEGADGASPSFDYYDTYFRRPGGARYLLDGTPHYFHGGARLVRAIDESLNNPRVVITLREPVGRVQSIYRFAQAMLEIPKEMSFDEFVSRCIEMYEVGARRPKEERAFWSVRGSIYADFLSPWLDMLPPDRVKVVFFEDLARDPAAVVTSVCNWLELEVPASLDYTVQNQTRMYRSRRLQTLALHLNSERYLRDRRTLKAPLRRLYYRLNGDSDKIDQGTEVVSELRRIFDPANRELARQLGARGYRTVPQWLEGSRSVPGDPERGGGLRA